MRKRNPDPAKLRAIIAELKDDLAARNRRIRELERTRPGPEPATDAPPAKKLRPLWILPVVLLAVLVALGAWRWVPWPEVLPGALLGTPAPPAETWLPIRRDGRWGFAYPDGTPALEPRFDNVTRFHEGRAGARDGGAWGFIDSTGRFVVPPVFDRVGLFSEGRARAVVAGRHGFVDRDGRRVIDFRYADATGFQEGLAAVREGALFGYIDRQGRMRIEPQFPEAYRFSEGLAVVHVASAGPRSERERAFLTKDGRLIRGDADRGRDFVDAYQFGDGLAPVQVRESRTWGFVRRDGTFAIPPMFTDVHQFSEGRAAYLIDDRFGYVDTSGRVVIPPRYAEVSSFSEGFAWVRQGSDVFFIDRSGARLDASLFSAAEPFRHGRARVEIGDRMAYIDTTGAFVWGPE